MPPLMPSRWTIGWDFPEVKERLRAGVDAADFYSGDGTFLSATVRGFLKNRLIDYDFSEDTVAAGLAEADRVVTSECSFALQHVAVLDKPEHFDLITAMDAIHDQAKPRVVLQVIYRSRS
jgi:hypothetical protein